jgi:hypothetical protein
MDEYLRRTARIGRDPHSPAAFCLARALRTALTGLVRPGYLRLSGHVTVHENS